ncbi:MAG TPA: Uma2 family endonuclease [Blastocatellia bacterium]|nr:Uma2 family endonuclease [Blastocatellia bacterium]
MRQVEDLISEPEIDLEAPEAYLLAEQRVFIRNVSWDVYDKLSASPGRSAPRFAYDKGLLEIMSPSSLHEEIKETTSLIVRLWGIEKRIKVRGFGSTTFRRKDLKRAFEPDTCFYIQSLNLLRLNDEIDLEKDPPPDIVVEIDITNSSMDKFPLFSEIGIGEVWRYGKGMRIFKLESGSYTEVDESPSLPGLTAGVLTELIQQSKTMEDEEWMELLRRYAGRSK